MVEVEVVVVVVSADDVCMACSTAACEIAPSPGMIGSPPPRCCNRRPSAPSTTADKVRLAQEYLAIHTFIYTFIQN